MMLDPMFVADVLAGIEGTLDEAAGRVENPELKTQVDTLRGQAEALRLCIESRLITAAETALP